MSLLQKAIIFQAKKVTQDFIFKSEYPLQEYFYEFSIDKYDFIINAVHLKAKKTKGLVFFLHGTFNHIQYHIPKVTIFLENDYDVVLIDYPRYGKSKGELSEDLLHQVVEISYQKTIETIDVSHNNIILVGRSLGTALASNLATKIHPQKLILISPYYNMPDLFRQKLKLFGFKRLKFKFENNIYLQQVTCETYVFHGTKDRLIPLHLSKKLLPFLKNAQNFIEIPNANHFNVHEQPLFKDSIKNILI